MVRKKINDEDANILMKTFKNNVPISDQGHHGNGKVISISGNICTVKYEDGYIEENENELFRIYKRL